MNKKHNITPIIRFSILVAALCLCIKSYADTHILVSKNPLEELETLVPGKQTTFDPAQMFTSLEKAHAYIVDKYGETIKEHVTVYVRGGNYGQERLEWKATSPQFTMKIISYNKEQVTFDGTLTRPNGEIPSRFMVLKRKYERTNFWIEGLIIQNYVNGIALGSTERKDGVYFNGIQNSHNTIKNNVFRNIGNKFTEQNEQVGYSTLGLSNSTHNLIESNIFYENENDKGNTQDLIHAIYLANYSSQNLIKDNYVSLCSGGAFRLRNACDKNSFENNYIERSGTNGFISEWYQTATRNPDSPELRSNDTFIKGNTCTFPYVGNTRSITLFSSIVNGGANKTNYVDGGHNFVISTSPICEQTGAVVSGDIDKDGTDELFVAFNYGNFTKLVRSDSNNPLYLSKVLHTNIYWRINALEINDFDRDGSLELITAFNKPSEQVNGTQIFKGDGINSATNYGMLYKSSKWKTAALTSGHYENNDTVQIFTAFNTSNGSEEGNTQVFKGLGTGENPVTNLGMVYNDSQWKTQAMTTGDFDGNGTEEVFIAFNALSNFGKSRSQIFKGSGTGNDPLTNMDKVYDHADWITKTLTSGDFDGNGQDEILSAFNSPTKIEDKTTQVLKGSGIGNAPLDDNGILYSNSWWKTGNLVSGNFINENDQSEEVAMFYSSKSDTQLFFGNGEQSLKSYGQYYRNTYSALCTQNDVLSLAKKANLYLENQNISISPNPVKTNEILTIKGVDDDYEVIIYTMTGKQIQTIKNKHKIELEGFSSGLYLIKIIQANGNTLKKLIVK